MSFTLEDQLKSVEVKQPVEKTRENPVRVQKLDKLGRAYGTGRRKESVARVWLKPGKGEVIVNGKSVLRYFTRSVLQTIVMQPFTISNRAGRYDVWCTVSGGGLSGQAGAVRHGISRALADYEVDLRSVLKSAGMMTRDSRTVERKKFGLMKARRSFQFSKR